MIPKTTGCSIRPTIISQFNSRQEPSEPIKLLTGENEPTEAFKSTINDIFNKYDIVINNIIEFQEFKAMIETIHGTSSSVAKKLTELEFKQTYLTKYEGYQQKGMTSKGFLAWWVDQLIEHGEESIFIWLEKVGGYNRDLIPTQSRLFNLTIHSRSLEDSEE